jgi:hypothetical protein
MSETPEIRNLGDGRYSFLVGRHLYSLTTQLDEESFRRVVEGVQNLVASFPPSLSQDERLFLSLMAMSHRFEELRKSIERVVGSIEERDEDS